MCIRDRDQAPDRAGDEVIGQTSQDHTYFVGYIDNEQADIGGPDLVMLLPEGNLGGRTVLVQFSVTLRIPGVVGISSLLAAQLLYNQVGFSQTHLGSGNSKMCIRDR